jgi:recombination protein RecA
LRRVGQAAASILNRKKVLVVKPDPSKAAARALDAALEAVRSKLKRTDFAVRLSEGGVRDGAGEVIPTGISVLDRWIIGTGGLPIGRSSEWSGPESAGKTSLSLLAIASVQRMGGIGIYGDAEHSFNEERAKTFGVDPARVMLVQCDTLEEYVPAMLAAAGALDGSVPALIVYDSIGGSATNAEVEGDTSGDAMGKKAGQVAKLVRGLTTVALRARAHVMFTNQIRKKVGVSFGDPTYTPGGDAPKFHCSLRVRLYPGEKLKVKDAVVGQVPSFRTIKNRHAVPHREAKVRFTFDRGWDELWSLCEHAKEMGCLPESSRPTLANYEAARKDLGWGAAPAPVEAAEADVVSAQKEEA